MNKGAKMRPNADKSGITLENVKEGTTAAHGLTVLNFAYLGRLVEKGPYPLSLGPLESDLVIQGMYRITQRDLFKRDADSMLRSYERADGYPGKPFLVPESS
jgi:hypothetical protein